MISLKKTVDYSPVQIADCINFALDWYGVTYHRMGKVYTIYTLDTLQSNLIPCLNYIAKKGIKTNHIIKDDRVINILIEFTTI